MIHWTDQVKEALTDHKPGQSVLKKGWGPLQELDLWRSRSTKLLDIEKQLQSSEVQHVLSILHISKSVYVQRFLRLTKEIQVGMLGNFSPPGLQTSSSSVVVKIGNPGKYVFITYLTAGPFLELTQPTCTVTLSWFHSLSTLSHSLLSHQLLFYWSALRVSGLQDHSQKAAVNVKFLSLLKEPCEELGRLRPSEAAPKMKRIIHLIYAIWANNQHYGSAERTGELFLMVLPTFMCYFIPSNNATQMWNKGLHQHSWGACVVAFSRSPTRSSVCAPGASLWTRSLRVSCRPAREP